MLDRMVLSLSLGEYMTLFFTMNSISSSAIFLGNTLDFYQLVEENRYKRLQLAQIKCGNVIATNNTHIMDYYPEVNLLPIYKSVRRELGKGEKLLWRSRGEQPIG